MAPRATRSNATKPSKTSSEPNTQPLQSPHKKLVTAENEQKRLFILPNDTSPDARIITLAHPAFQSPTRHLFCPEKGLFEFTCIAAPKTIPQSWLIAGHKAQDGADEESAQDARPLSRGYVLGDASLFISTPIDPIFFLTLLLVQQQRTGNAMFRMEEDHIDTLSETSPEVARMLRRPEFRCLLLRRLEAMSEVQDLGDEKVYKPNVEKLTDVLLSKARRMIQPDTWPASLEEAFVRKQLEVPVLEVAQDVQLPTPEDSQASEASEKIEAKVDAPAVSAQTGAPEINELMRTRVAFNYMLSSYIPARLRPALEQSLEKNAAIDFMPLTQHLEKVKAAKTEAQALRTMSDNISRKRGCLDDDEAMEARAEKKRKKEEEEKRKKAESRAVKELKKVNTTGMKKLSSFFTAKAPAADAVKK